MCTITLSLAKRGEAIPGPYSSLTCFAGVRPGAVPERGEIGGHRHRRARWTFHSGQRRRHAHELRPCRRLSGEARDRLWRSGSRPSISSSHGPRGGLGLAELRSCCSSLGLFPQERCEVAAAIADRLHTLYLRSACGPRYRHVGFFPFTTFSFSRFRLPSVLTLRLL